MSDNLKQIAHKFIFKFGDVDRETMDDVFDGLEAYYGFLARRKIVVARDFNLFREKIHSMRDEVIGKMERYNAEESTPPDGSSVKFFRRGCEDSQTKESPNSASCFCFPARYCTPMIA